MNEITAVVVRIRLAVVAVVTLAAFTGSADSQSAPAGSCGARASDPAILWCDDFEATTPMAQKYLDYNNNGGDFVPVAGQGVGGTKGLRAVWQAGETNAGAFKRMFGRNPVNSQSHSTQDVREIYWREYVRTGEGWTGNPHRLSGASVFAASSGAQAMVAKVWGDGVGEVLLLDPASGISTSGQLTTTKYDDFDHLRGLGARRGRTPVFSAASANRWHCIETHVKLNAPGVANGLFELWIDGRLEGSRTDLNWVGAWQAYGINAVSFENYWNGGAPAARTRYIDDIVISRNRVGCADAALPAAPKGLRLVPGDVQWQ